MKYLITIAGCLVILNTVNGQEPWDNYQIQSPPEHVNYPKTECHNTVQNCITDVFYRKFLKTIVIKGRFEDDTFVAELRYELMKLDHDLLKRLASTSVALSAEELRKVDNILLNQLVEPSLIKKSFYFSLEHFKDILYFGIVPLMLFLFVKFKEVFYRSISTVFGIQFFRSIIPLRFIFMTLIIGLLYLWEYKLAFENEEIETMKEFHEKTEDSWSIFDYFYTSSKPKKIHITIKSFYEVAHPATIFSRLLSKCVITPLIEVFGGIDIFAKKVSNNFGWPISGFVHIGINVILGLGLLSMFLTFIWAILLGRPINFNFLGLKMGLGERKKEKKKYRENNKNQKNSSDVNMGLISLSHGLLQLASRNILIDQQDNKEENEKLIHLIPSSNQLMRPIKKPDYLKQRSSNFTRATNVAKMDHLRKRRISF